MPLMAVIAFENVVQQPTRFIFNWDVYRRIDGPSVHCDDAIQDLAKMKLDLVPNDAFLIANWQS
jgi:hypothetical protein